MAWELCGEGLSFDIELSGIYILRSITMAPINHLDNSVTIGQTLELTTERLAYGGDAIAHHDGLAIFIPFAAPAETLRVRITERKKNFARATIEAILVPSPVRQNPPCTYYGTCGGCQLQHINYAAQLSAKATFISDALQRIGHIDWPHEIEVRSAGELGYRTRAQVKAAAHASGPAHDVMPDPIRIGFNKAGSHAICDVVSCPILVPELNSALGALRSELSNNPKALTTHSTEFDLAAGDDSVSCQPPVTGLASGPVRQTVGGISYNFGPKDFFQSNRFLLEDLINIATENEAGDLAIDLYAGVGLFSARLATTFNRVLAVESDRQAVAFGRPNMTNNRLRNVKFINERAEAWLRQHLSDSGAAPQRDPDLVLLDPPRGGASALIKDLASLRPERITYVSCDPVTLSRDLANLASQYQIKRIVGFDLFPQTYHVETIAKLEIK